MKFRVTNSYKDAHMTSLQGEINTNYARLVELFGRPISGSGDGKVNSEWIIKFSDGLVATIYDYKEPITPTDAYDWHIGGKNRAVVQRVTALVNQLVAA